MTVKVYSESVRENAPRDRNGAMSVVIGERSTLIYEGDKEGAEAALRALPIGESVAVRHAGGIRSCMNKPLLWAWVATL